MKIFIVLFLFIFLVFHPGLCFQDANHQHEEHKNHVGFLIGAVYNVTEAKYLLGLGFEYERVLPFWDNLVGIGIASEVVFDEHRHYALSVLFPVHPTREITFFLAPGIMFIDKEDEVEKYFSIHFGAEYEIELDKIFLAPTFEAAFAGEDIHLLLGIHIGFGW